MTNESENAEARFSYVKADKLRVAATLYRFIEDEALPKTGIDSALFWQGFSDIVAEFAPRNKTLLEERDQMQKQLDDWHRQHRDEPFDKNAYKTFLSDIGYLRPEPNDFSIQTTNVDDEIGQIAGPQLVVPVINARFALNATNARWGSLYDALYGTDAIPEKGGAERTSDYNPVRGEKVIEFAKTFLDQAAPLASGSHADATEYSISEDSIDIKLTDGTHTQLADQSTFFGYVGDTQAPSNIFLENNGLKIEICIDRDSVIGRSDSAGVSDINLEAALTTIQDCEDSVAAVDAFDKTQVYRNWLGLMLGTLEERFEKSGKTLTRTMNTDRIIIKQDGTRSSISCRSLLLVRNVGHLMTMDAILDADGNQVPEGIMDGVITSLIGLHDVKNNGRHQNSRTGSIYIVKPKMHGPDEVAFTCDLFTKIEQLFSLTPNTIKMGIMDEERRTTLNLKECIKVAKERLVFINTGFLDRTGDEIHTSIYQGPMIPKGTMKSQPWINAYENWNVDIGLSSGLQGRAQIGKGMWAMPDEMAKMLSTKIEHPKSGANTAWVPSPNAATIHALHYHQVDVTACQNELKSRACANINDILEIPVMQDSDSLSPEQIQAELDNNVQGLLGYVVRWINQGIGCSKVPDINNVELMEDRATLRISSQHLCNWLLHGICTEQQVTDTLIRMAAIVDSQNNLDSTYKPMSTDLESSLAFQAAKDLIFKGTEQPNGYTEPLLHEYRRKVKQEASA